jgi:hypothetical protein
VEAWFYFGSSFFAAAVSIGAAIISTSAAQLDAVPTWANWLTRWPGITFAFLWGFAEGTLFFILPDVPFSLAAMFRPRRAHGPAARRAVAQVPLVTPAMFERAESDYSQFGVWAGSRGPVRGIPYKVYAVEAPEHCSLWPFLLVTIPARMWRLLVVWLGFACAGMFLRKIGRASLAPALHATFWLVVYVAYWARVK